MVLHKKNGISKCKGFVNFEDKESATKAISFFETLQKETDERKRAESLESANPCLENEYMKLKVSPATRKEKQKPRRRFRAETEPQIHQQFESRSRASSQQTFTPPSFPGVAAPVQLIQPYVYYVPVTYPSAGSPVGRGRSSTEPFVMTTQPYYVPNPTAYWCP